MALSPWPVAYGPYIGARNMTTENYFDSSRGGIPSGTSIGGGRTWREGQAQIGRRLEGNLINIVRPAEVVVFIDGGNDPVENAMRDEAQVIDSDHGWGAYLPGYAIKSHGLPVTRHSKKGGLSAALADGHAEYLRPVSWHWHEGQTFVERFSPHPRVTPYAAFDTNARPEGTTRR